MAHGCVNGHLFHFVITYPQLKSTSLFHEEGNNNNKLNFFILCYILKRYSFFFHEKEKGKKKKVNILLYVHVCLKIQNLLHRKNATFIFFVAKLLKESSFFSPTDAVKIIIIHKWHQFMTLAREYEKII